MPRRHRPGANHSTGGRAARLTKAISGPATLRETEYAGRMAGFDRPDELADTVAEFPAGG